MAELWGVIEPILYLFQFLSGLRLRNFSKVSEKQFDTLTNQAFNDIRYHLEYFGAHEAIKAEPEMYIRHLKNQIKQQNGKFIFLDGEIHLKLLKRFHLPKMNSCDNFLIKSFFFIYGFNKILSYLLIKDRLEVIFGKKNTFGHYISIPQWRKKKISVLSKEVVKIRKVTKDYWNDRYLIPKNEDISKSKPFIGKAIDKVLSNGVISEKSIFNLASSEKLIFVHKYAEGWDFYRQYQEDARKAKNEVTKWQKSQAQNADNKLTKAKEKLSKIEKNWLQVPIGYALEQYGFQKLFRKMDGVYVIPLSILPEKYHNNIESYINDLIVNKAEVYLEEAKKSKNPYINHDNELKYMILSHVIPVSDIVMISEHRTIEISSPALSRMLFTSYLATDNSKVSNLYINDVIKNVDFTSLLKQSKTDKLLDKNIEQLKNTLWQQNRVDLLKPSTMSTLTQNNIHDLATEMLKIDANFSRYHLVKRLSELVDFYKNLSIELAQIKK